LLNLDDARRQISELAESLTDQKVIVDAIFIDLSNLPDDPNTENLRRQYIFAMRELQRSIRLIERAKETYIYNNFNGTNEDFPLKAKTRRAFIEALPPPGFEVDITTLYDEVFEIIPFKGTWRGPICRTPGEAAAHCRTHQRELDTAIRSAGGS
jgi:hypothetical protein